MAKDPDLLAVGSRIQLARERAGLDQKDLAEGVGVSPRTIGGYESGDINPYRKLQAIADRTNVSSEWLGWGDDGPPGSGGRPDGLESVVSGVLEAVRILQQVAEELERPRSLRRSDD